jgi:nitrogenase molybdenum-iron protein alpha/beta subunit
MTPFELIEKQKTLIDWFEFLLKSLKVEVYGFPPDTLIDTIALLEEIKQAYPSVQEENSFNEARKEYFDTKVYNYKSWINHIKSLVGHATLKSLVMTRRDIANFCFEINECAVDALKEVECPFKFKE